MKAQRVRECLEVVSFMLGQEKYGVETRYVREVCPLNELTPLPGTPPFVLGIVNVRGQVLSVIDIRKLFDLPQKGVGDLDRVIVLQHGGMEFGILANSILGVVQVPTDDLQPSLPTLDGPSRGVSQGCHAGSDGHPRCGPIAFRREHHRTRGSLKRASQSDGNGQGAAE